MNPERAIARMRELVEAGVPYVHQGRDLVGIDCVGAIVYATEYSGPVPAYPTDPINGELEKNLTAAYGPPVFERPFDPLLLSPGDIVAMQYRGPIRHVGMLARHPSLSEELSVIHTDRALGKVTEHILDGKWLRRITKVWR